MLLPGTSKVDAICGGAVCPKTQVSLTPFTDFAPKCGTQTRRRTKFCDAAVGCTCEEPPGGAVLVETKEGPPCQAIVRCGAGQRLVAERCERCPAGTFNVQLVHALSDCLPHKTCVAPQVVLLPGSASSDTVCADGKIVVTVTAKASTIQTVATTITAAETTAGKTTAASTAAKITAGSTAATTTLTTAVATPATTTADSTVIYDLTGLDDGTEIRDSVLVAVVRQFLTTDLGLPASSPGLTGATVLRSPTRVRLPFELAARAATARENSKRAVALIAADYKTEMDVPVPTRPPTSRPTPAPTEGTPACTTPDRDTCDELVADANGDCNDPFYVDLLRNQCPNRCGFCTGAVAPPTTLPPRRTAAQLTDATTRGRAQSAPRPDRSQSEGEGGGTGSAGAVIAVVVVLLLVVTAAAVVLWDRRRKRGRQPGSERVAMIALTGRRRGENTNPRRNDRTALSNGRPARSNDRTAQREDRTARRHDGTARRAEHTAQGGAAHDAQNSPALERSLMYDVVDTKAEALAFRKRTNVLYIQNKAGETLGSDAVIYGIPMVAGGFGKTGAANAGDPWLQKARRFKNTPDHALAGDPADAEGYNTAVLTARSDDTVAGGPAYDAGFNNVYGPLRLSGTAPSCDVATRNEATAKEARWRCQHEDLELGKRLGSGNFGDVCLGTMVATGTKVAVKTCKDTVPDPARFLEEAAVLKEYDHPNIVTLIGVVSEKPIYIILELCLGGELLAALRKNKELTVPHCIKMSSEAAEGMAYLHSKLCIHRDLAARNCLVTSDGVVKISDFGMSRLTASADDVYTVDTTAQTIPIRWTAPEALSGDRTYSLATDVWAFAVLMWEIFSKGMQPYPGMTNAQVRDLVVTTTERMRSPRGCPAEVYQLMTECWAKAEAERPQMRAVADYHHDLAILYPPQTAAEAGVGSAV